MQKSEVFVSCYSLKKEEFMMCEGSLSGEQVFMYGITILKLISTDS